jgi:hypothetical protein
LNTHERRRPSGKPRRKGTRPGGRFMSAIWLSPNGSGPPPVSARTITPDLV